MPHVFEPAPTGRARCRGCAQPIRKADLRFGERIPNPFGDGEATLWFHPRCAAHKRPEPLLEALPIAPADLQDRGDLQRIATLAAAHRRLPRIDGAERAPSGQAKCRSCRAPIARGEWRIKLAFYEDGRFTPGGFVHLACREVYFETSEVLEALLQFSHLDDPEREALLRAYAEPAVKPQ